MLNDCGALCGAACCQPDADGQGGVHLFPGEEAQNDPLPEGFTLTADDGVMPGMRLLTCVGSCRRDQRPLACRMFPLTPVLIASEGKEQLRVRVDPRAFAVCPLSASGVRGMDAAFGRAVLEAARTLCLCGEHRAYIRALSAYFERLKTW